MARRFAPAALALSMMACGSIDAMVLSPERPSLAYRHEDDVTPKSPAVTRFFAIGDAGEREDGDPREPRRSTKLVACDVRRTCDALGGCDFGLFLGDNVYPTGIGEGEEGREDAEFLRRFTGELYQGTGALYFVLGNHDWGPHWGYGAPPSTERARRELAVVEELSWPWRTDVPKVRGRSHFYDFSASHVRVFAWDTNYIVHKCHENGSCPEALDAGIAALSKDIGHGEPFSVVVGHHPYLSNGEHGNAGEFKDTVGSVGNGEGLRRLLVKHVIGKAALYVSGHDHNLQAYLDASPEEPQHGTAVVVSGAGTKTNPPGHHPKNKASFACYEKRLGYSVVEATKDQITVRMYALREDTTCAALEPAFVMSRGRRDKLWKWVAGSATCPP